MRLHLHTVAALALFGLLINSTAQAADITQASWLDSQPKPAFKPGHTLPHLTRYAFALPVDAAINFCEDWGYALEFSFPLSADPGDPYNVGWRLNDPNSPESRLAALAKSDPVRYPLQAAISQQVPNESQAPSGTFSRNANGETLYSGTAQQSDGTTIPAGPVWSLEAPAATWDLFAAYRVSGIQELKNRGIPIAYILNGGEYAPMFWHNSHTFWEQDLGYDTGIRQSLWGSGYDFQLEYCSAKAAQREHIISVAVKAAAPQRSLYIPYTAGGQTERNRYWGMPEYGGFWKHTRGIGDLPSNESYFRSNGGGFVVPDISNRPDILTQALNAKALEIQTGDPLSYNWISAGWDGNEAEETRWAGFLKCYYTAGMIGCNVGAYGSGWPAIINPTFSNSGPVPVHLRHMVISSHVHALFSQVENLVRNGDLLPGPAQHEMSGDVPAYEFPTGEGVNSRVLARKHRTDATWLITAWAAAGNDRNVSVYIPELGQITLQARIVGSVYTATLANGNVTLTRIDDEGATYTAVANGTPVTAATNLVIPSPLATNRLLWLSADSEVTADGAGKVSAWGSLGNDVSIDQTQASKRPTLVANAINGKPALRFVNTQTWLQGSIAGNGFDGYLTAFVVFTPAGTTNKTLISAGNGNQFFSMNDDAINYESVTSNGITRKVFPRDFLAAPLTSFMIGDTIQYGAGNYNGLSGDISEILVYKNITSQTASLVKEYLDDKYSLSGSGTLSNGSFESPVVASYRYTPDAGSWYFTNTSAIQANGSAFGANNAPNGSQTAVIQGAGKQLGSMSQTIKLAAGNYTLSFKAARRSGEVQPLKVCIDQIQIGGLITPAGDGFQDFAVNFSVSAGKHTVRFEATDGSGDKSTFIDQVAVNLVVQVSDGSFEAPAVSGFAYNPTASPWSFDINSAIQANGSSLNAAVAPDGIQTAVVKGSSTGLGGISQMVNFGDGGTFRVSLKAARRNGQIQPLKFSVDGTQVGSLITPNNDAFTSYATGTFTVSRGSHLLRFEATNAAGDNSTFIDQVILSAPIFPSTLQSGSFETPAVSGFTNKFQYNPTGSDWIFSAQSAIQANGSAWNAATAPDGIQTAVLQSTGSISQTVALAAGTYTLGFKAARRASDGGVQPVKFSVDGSQISAPISPSGTTFASYITASFIVTAGNHTLRLEGTDSIAGKASFIDQVVLNTISLDSEPLEIRAFTRDISGNFTLDFLGAPLTNYRVTKSDMMSPFGPLTIPLSVTTDDVGIGQALIPASEASEMKEFYRIEK